MDENKYVCEPHCTDGKFDYWQPLFPYSVSCRGCAYEFDIGSGDFCEMCSRCHPDRYEPIDAIQTDMSL